MRWPASGGILFGGDYNPDQWPEEVWHEDVALMKVAGVNIVTLGVFAWSRLEPSPGQWDFAWLDRVSAILRPAEVLIDLATATASPPPWFARRHPDALPITASGQTLDVGSRGHYCPSSPAYRRAAGRLVRKLARRYSGADAPALWHVNNELGEKVVECFCPTSATAFRRWVQDRYRTLDRLNAAWGTDVWSQRYSAWDQIQPPRLGPGPLNPSQRLDYRRFSSDAHRECFELERAILRRYTPDVPVTTNFMGPLSEVRGGFFGGIDYWSLAPSVDVVADDSYPDPLDRLGHINAAMNFDLMRSLGRGRPWLLMEQAPGAMSWLPVNPGKPAGRLLLESMQAVARGADGIMFFQWRQARSGQEKFATGMLPHGGTRTQTWREIVSLGATLRAVGEVAGTTLSADVAILIDWESWWALELGDHPNNELTFGEVAFETYRALFELGVTVDFAKPAADLSRYRVVVAPNLYAVATETASHLERFVASGGTLVVGPFSGIVDENDQVHDGSYPGAFGDLLGLRIDSFWPHPTESWSIAFGAERSSARLWTDWIELEGASSVATIGSGPLDGRPAVTDHAVGLGRALYVGAFLDGDGWSSLFRGVLAAAGVHVPDGLAPGVEWTRRSGGGVTFDFFLNHADHEVRVTGVNGRDLVGGTELSGRLQLSPAGVAVVRSSLTETPVKREVHDRAPRRRGGSR